METNEAHTNQSGIKYVVDIEGTPISTKKVITHIDNSDSERSNEEGGHAYRLTQAQQLIDAYHEGRLKEYLHKLQGGE